jgi:hypothetical protein
MPDASEANPCLRGNILSNILHTDVEFLPKQVHE